MLKRSKTEHVIRREADIPKDFGSEAEEAAYWKSARFTDRFLRSTAKVPAGVLPVVRGHTHPVAIRFDDDVMRRLKVVAERKGKGYQTLLKEFVAERLYQEELREGIIPPTQPGELMTRSR